jgi:hypothetical protein
MAFVARVQIHVARRFLRITRPAGRVTAVQFRQEKVKDRSMETRNRLTFASAFALVLALAATPLMATGNGSDKDDKDHRDYNWDKGDKGDKDDDARFGGAQVIVQRGDGSPAVWAQYSTPLGSPLGDSTGGAFRLTCDKPNDTKKYCQLSLKALVLSNKPTTGWRVYPRVLIQKEAIDPFTGLKLYCEYGDGSFGAPVPNSNPSGFFSVSASPLAGPYAWGAVPINVGGSADCGLVSVTFVPNVDEPVILLPTGFRYDVTTSFVFLKP